MPLVNTGNNSSQNRNYQQNPYGYANTNNNNLNPYLQNR